jgi:hypothetical protein
VRHLVQAVPCPVCNLLKPQFVSRMKHHPPSHTVARFPSVALRECTSTPCTFTSCVGMIRNQHISYYHICSLYRRPVCKITKKNSDKFF